ncbi:MAG: hypothetical protein C5B52_14520 [Bacteroidetes bacterium]|nr:MAG: hypothetical protein C5B52_14520 [Bacteroidota bacterium]
MEQEQINKTRTEKLIRSCMKCWLICEAMVRVELEKSNSCQRIIDSCRICSSVCLSTAGLFIAKETVPIQSILLLAYMTCRNCVRECEVMNDENTNYCMNVCDASAQIFMEFINEYSLN